MIDAIIYESNSGFTKKYAMLLSDATGLPCYTTAEALNSLKKGYKVIFLGWLRAGSIVGLKKAQSGFEVLAAVGVGMRAQNSVALTDMKNQNKLGDLPAFYLRGGMDMSKLHGLNKLMLQFALKVMSQKPPKDDPEASETMDMMQNGKEFVSPANLKEILDWYNNKCTNTL